MASQGVSLDKHELVTTFPAYVMLFSITNTMSVTIRVVFVLQQYCAFMRAYVCVGVNVTKFSRSHHLRRNLSQMDRDVTFKECNVRDEFAIRVLIVPACQKQHYHSSSLGVNKTKKIIDCLLFLSAILLSSSNYVILFILLNGPLNYVYFRQSNLQLKSIMFPSCLLE